MSGERANGGAVTTGEVTSTPFEEIARATRRRIAWRLALALLCAALLGALIDGLVGGGAGGAGRRSSYSPEADGYRGIAEVLARLGLTVRRHRVSYGALPDPAATLLLVLDPLSEEELALLHGIPGALGSPGRARSNAHVRQVRHSGPRRRAASIRA
ncbi:MAG: DUF4350 domain-containing protein [Candidatus Schekmanbacteria bacterium]|nr:DUF4350 domain-containing protein [Candidatus Schekmanbacteria bacterium]